MELSRWGVHAGLTVLYEVGAAGVVIYQVVHGDTAILHRILRYTIIGFRWSVFLSDSQGNIDVIATIFCQNNGIGLHEHEAIKDPAGLAACAPEGSGPPAAAKRPKRSPQ